MLLGAQGVLLVAGLLLVFAGVGGWPMLALLLLASLNLGVACHWLWRSRWRRPKPREPRRDVAPVATGELVEVVEADAEGLQRRLLGLEADLAEQHRQVDRLAAGRERARQESQLKSDYLALLGKELKPIAARLDHLLQAGEPSPAALGEIRERLDELATLLADITGEPEAAGPEGQLRGGRVLIVDDGPVNLMLARQVLEREGFEVEVATSGREALARLEAHPFDLVLMDIFMPEMDGVETARRWRLEEAHRYPGRRSTLVALTANANDLDRARFREAGLDDYLAKPYRPQALVDRVRFWLADRFQDH